jgi:hypothetical protein
MTEATFALSTPTPAAAAAATPARSELPKMAARKLDFFYNGSQALKNVSLDIAEKRVTALNNQYWTGNLNSPMASVPVVIFQYAMSPYDSWHALAWAGAFVVTVFVLLLSVLSRAILLRNKVSND